MAKTYKDSDQDGFFGPAIRSATSPKRVKKSNKVPSGVNKKTTQKAGFSDRLNNAKTVQDYKNSAPKPTTQPKTGGFSDRLNNAKTVQDYKRSKPKGAPAVQSGPTETQSPVGGIVTGIDVSTLPQGPVQPKPQAEEPWRRLAGSTVPLAAQPEVDRVNRDVAAGRLSPQTATDLAGQFKQATDAAVAGQNPDVPPSRYATPEQMEEMEQRDNANADQTIADAEAARDQREAEALAVAAEKEKLDQQSQVKQDSFGQPLRDVQQANDPNQPPLQLGIGDQRPPGPNITYQGALTDAGVSLAAQEFARRQNSGSHYAGDVGNYHRSLDQRDPSMFLPTQTPTDAQYQLNLADATRDLQQGISPGYAKNPDGSAALGEDGRVQFGQKFNDQQTHFPTDPNQPHPQFGTVSQNNKRLREEASAANPVHQKARDNRQAAHDEAMATEADKRAVKNKAQNEVYADALKNRGQGIRKRAEASRERKTDRTATRNLDPQGVADYYRSKREADLTQQQIEAQERATTAQNEMTASENQKNRDSAERIARTRGSSQTGYNQSRQYKIEGDSYNNTIKSLEARFKLDPSAENQAQIDRVLAGQQAVYNGTPRYTGSEQGLENWMQSQNLEFGSTIVMHDAQGYPIVGVLEPSEDEGAEFIPES